MWVGLLRRGVDVVVFVPCRRACTLVRQMKTIRRGQSKVTPSRPQNARQRKISSNPTAVFALS